MSQSKGTKLEETHDNDLLDMMKGTMIFTGLFMGIALVGGILAYFYQ
ncbi:hypothetical protein SAMN05444487_10418 [Marininema mesophilum]|uniref:YqzM-like protein n=1 Tax=Marininema mesophilum TaxID=1048340 RepID=A0A1H2U6N7_9BACL|nr:hypothetical protein [Marininema mesophilum]SDW51791.1 hypothetical protein SAMN05444487_10418 [Marininema mesophilum]